MTVERASVIVKSLLDSILGMIQNVSLSNLAHPLFLLSEASTIDDTINRNNTTIFLSF